MINAELRLAIYSTQKKSLENLLLSISKLKSCGCRTRTCDLQVMSLASYQLLQPAILIKINSSMNRSTFLNCECKGSGLLRNRQRIIHYLTNYPLCFCGFQALSATITISNSAGMCTCISSHKDIKFSITYHKRFMRFDVEMT